MSDDVLRSKKDTQQGVIELGREDLEKIVGGKVDWLDFDIPVPPVDDPIYSCGRGDFIFR